MFARASFKMGKVDVLEHRKGIWYCNIHIVEGPSQVWEWRRHVDNVPKGIVIGNMKSYVTLSEVCMSGSSYRIEFQSWILLEKMAGCIINQGQSRESANYWHYITSLSAITFPNYYVCSHLCYSDFSDEEDVVNSGLTRSPGVLSFNRTEIGGLATEEEPSLLLSRGLAARTKSWEVELVLLLLPQYLSTSSISQL